MEFLTVLLVVGVFALVYGLGPWAVGFCRSQGLVVEISERSLHATPTPQGGGILLVGVCTPIMLVLIWLLQLPQREFLTVLLLVALPLAYMGWLDDKAHQHPLKRLLVHIGCVAVGVWFLPPLFDVVPVWVEKIVLILAWAWFVNLYNFMDGLDGLATSQAVFISLGLAVLVPQLAPVACVLAAGCLGFLRVNWQRARLFMGDVGSTYLGFVLGGLLLVALEWNTWMLVAPLFTLTLVFSGDATYTLFKRMAQGHKPWIPHREFWTHQAADVLGDHQRVVLRVMGLNLMLLVFVWFELQTGLRGVSLLLGLALMVWVGWRIARLKRKG